MTMDPDLDPLDELVSAYLDDEVTPGERVQVEADPELLTRVERLRPAVTALRAPVEIDHAERETALTAALAVFTPGPVAAPDPAPPAAGDSEPADQLAAAHRRRERRAERTRRVGAWLGAAAAAGAIGVFASGGIGGDSDDASSSADVVAASDLTAAAPAETIDAIGGGAEVAGDGNATAAAESQSAETIAAAAADESSAQVAVAFTTDTELADYVRSIVVARRTSGATVPATIMAPPCGLPAGLRGDSMGSAAWKGDPGELFLVPSALEPTAAVILSADCATVLVRVEL